MPCHRWSGEHRGGNRIIRITDDQQALIAEYDYDALGRRIRSYDGLAETAVMYYYSADWQVLAESDGSSFTNEYVYGNDVTEPLVVNDGANDYFYLHDHLYSTVALLSSAGAVVERYEYDAYGKATVWNAALTTTYSASQYNNSYLFAGYRFDANTNLYHVRHRSYDPIAARWLQHDPLGYADSMSLYEYVTSNPVRYTDPFGLYYNTVYTRLISDLDSFQKSIKSMNCAECNPADFGPEPSKGRRGNWGWLQAVRHYLAGRSTRGIPLLDTDWTSTFFPAFGGLKRLINPYTDWGFFEKDFSDSSRFVPGFRQFGETVEFAHDSKFSQRLTNGTMGGFNYWDLGDAGDGGRGGITGRLDRKATEIANSMGLDGCKQFTLNGDKVNYNFSDNEENLWDILGFQDGAGTLSSGNSDQYSQGSWRANCCVKKGCSRLTLKCRVRIDIHDLYTWDRYIAAHLGGRDFWQIVHFDKFYETEINSISR